MFRNPLEERGCKGGQNQNWLPNSCLLEGPQVGGNATSPLRQRGQNQDTKKTKKKQKQKFSHDIHDSASGSIVTPTGV